MEVRGEPFAGGYEVDGLVRNEVRLDGRNTVTHDTFHFVECTNQVDESLACRLAEVADIDSGQHDFLSTFGSYLPCLLHHTGDCAVAASSAGKRNGTIGAEVIASVLYFQEMTRTVVCRTGRGEGPYIFSL